jgi:hypothetical protein
MAGERRRAMIEWARRDPGLNALREDPAFKEVVDPSRESRADALDDP